MTELSFGELLRVYRLAANLTQEELAERAGLSARGISDLERGARGLPRKDTLQLLLPALDLPPADQAALVAAARRAPAPARGDAHAEHPLMRRQNSLPVQPTPFLGREQTVATVADVLRREARRLVTITGPGGVGKTRLAVQVAATLLEVFPDGV